MADRDWQTLYAVVLQGLDDYDPPQAAGSDLSTAQRERLAETLTDHLAASLASGALRKRARWWTRRGAHRGGGQT